MRHTFLFLFASLICLSVYSAPGSETQSDSGMRFALNDWAGQRLSSRIMGEALTRMGFPVVYVQTPYKEELELIANDSLDVAMEVWSTTLKEEFQKAVADGSVLNLGETGMTAMEDWWYPDYMSEKCPGLPAWTALNECAGLFATAESKPKGFYLGGPADWGGHDEGRIAALKLNFDMRHANSDEELNSALKQAYSNKEPIMLWVYSPNFTEAVYKGHWVQFPKYEDACYEDPSWGVNPELPYDCGKPSGPIWKAGSHRLKKTWPLAVAAIEKFSITNAEMAALVKKVEVEGQSETAVAAEWLDNHVVRWSLWFK
ncbi:MAG: ABC transporter substrate-binding protein [Pseudomonadota bacterium]